MAISQIGIAQSTIPQNKYNFSTVANTPKVLESSFSAGVYTFTFSASTKISIAFYNAAGTLIQSQNSTTSYSNLVFVLSVPFSKVLFMTDTNISITIDIIPTAPLKASFSSQFITSTQSITLASPTTAILVGGGGGTSGGPGWGGAGSGYCAVGTLAAGTYTATIGAGGIALTTGSATSIGSLTAAGGNPNNGQVGGAGGSGGAGGGASGTGGANGGNGAGGGYGGGGAGSGITLGIPIIPGIGGTSGSTAGTAGGVYAGGGSANGGGSGTGGFGGANTGAGAGACCSGAPNTANGGSGFIMLLTNL